MKNNKKKSLLIGMLLLVLLAWAPWITVKQAEKAAIIEFTESQEDIVADGCGLNCPDCGVINVAKMPFGYKVEIQFKCGMKNYFKQKSYFVSFLGTIH